MLTQAHPRRIAYPFVPLPQEIWRRPATLSRAEFCLLGYLLMQQGRWGKERLVFTDDELLRGRRTPRGERLDSGCGVRGPANLVRARQRLRERGWLQYAPGRMGMVYRLQLSQPESEARTSETDACTIETKALNKEEESVPLKNIHRRQPAEGAEDCSSEVYQEDDAGAAIRIYRLYPRRVNARAAVAAIAAAVARLQRGEAGVELAPAEALIFLEQATLDYAQSPAGQSGRFTPYPANWFANSRYLDDPREWWRE